MHYRWLFELFNTQAELQNVRSEAHRSDLQVPKRQRNVVFPLMYSNLMLFLTHCWY